MTMMHKPGTIFARKYKIVKLLGEGGFAETYLAEHTLLDGQLIALKALRPALWKEQELRARFQLEARIAMQLRHPNIIPLWEFDVTPEGFPYYTMEVSPGDTLKTFIEREGRFDPLRATRTIRQILDALIAAHALGIVHRDIKPSNIMFEVGPAGEVVRLFDFGLAKIVGGPALTAPNQIIGTPRYISPEQARHDPIDGRCDIYLTGLVFYELLAGRMPFMGPTILNFIQQHLNEEPPAFAKVAREAEVPAELEAAVRKALQKEPEARWRSAREFADALDDLTRTILARRTTRSFAAPLLSDPAASPFHGDLTAAPALPPCPANPPKTKVSKPSGKFPEFAASGEHPSRAALEGLPSETPVPTAAPALARPRARLQIRYSFGGSAYVLHVHVGSTARFGRLRRPAEGQSWNEVPTFVLRYLPVDDPRGRQMTDGTISRLHFEIRIEGERVLLTDLSSKGTYVDGKAAKPEVPQPIEHGQVITPGAGPLALQTWIYRHRRSREVLAVKLTRLANGETHAYLVLPKAAPIGSAPGVALRLDADQGVRPLHAILHPAGEECLMIEPCGGGPLLVGAYSVPPTGAAPLLPGYQATLGTAPIALAAYFPDSDAALR